MNPDPDPNSNNARRTGPGGVYDEQLPETRELTELKMFIEVGVNRLDISISQQFAALSHEIQLLAIAAESSQGRNNANNASASEVNLTFVSKTIVMLMAFAEMLGFLKSAQETTRLGITRRREC